MIGLMFNYFMYSLGIASCLIMGVVCFSCVSDNDGWASAGLFLAGVFLFTVLILGLYVGANGALGTVCS